MTTNEGEVPRFMSVSAGGFSAFSDAMLYDQEEGQVWFLSMLGALTSVRAIWASIVKNPPDSLHALPEREEENEVRNYFRLMIPSFTIGTWTNKVARLNVTGGWHSIAYTKLAEYGNEYNERKDFLLTSFGSETSLIRNHYHFLDRRTDLPLHETWSDWIWDRGIAEDEIRQLTGHNMQGFYCLPNEELLKEDICKAVRTGKLRIEKEEMYALGRTG